MRYGLVSAAVALTLALGAGGLWLAARLWPERLCDTQGWRVHAQRDARSQGYLLQAKDERELRGAVYDLVQGRVEFFERRTDQGLSRYRLGSRHSAHCLKRERVDALLEGMPMPAAQCVTAGRHAQGASRYRVQVEPARTGGLQSVRVTDLHDETTLAEYRRTPLLPAVLLALACPRPRPGLRGGSFTSLTGLVFKDRWGQVLPVAEIGATELGEQPPVEAVRARLAADGLLDAGECHLPGWMGDTEVHEIELPGGPLEVEARLDPNSRTAGTVLLDVHTPDKAAVIIARAKRPTIWHVHESGRSSIVAFLVRGEGGQAVLGLTPHTRILMSTREHSPATNCSHAELARIERELARHYGRPRQHRQIMEEGKPAVRYGIGEPMSDGSLLFHYEAELSDYEVSGK